MLIKDDPNPSPPDPCSRCWICPRPSRWRRWFACHRSSLSLLLFQLLSFVLLAHMPANFARGTLKENWLEPHLHTSATEKGHSIKMILVPQRCLCGPRVISTGIIFVVLLPVQGSASNATSSVQKSVQIFIILRDIFVCVVDDLRGINLGKGVGEYRILTATRAVFVSKEKHSLKSCV